jgi:hypothetical protein
MPKIGKMAEAPPSSICDDCGGPWYRDAAPMLIEATWSAIGGKPWTVLCESCLHARMHNRLGRALTFADLLDCNFNVGWERPGVTATDPVTLFDPYIERWNQRQRAKVKRDSVQRIERGHRAWMTRRAKGE